MTLNRVSTLAVLLLIVSFLSPRSILAAYGAGNSSNIPVTSQGLKGEIIAPQYIASPDTYVPSTQVTINAKISNPTNQTVRLTSFFRVYKVTQAPIGTDVSSGQPNTPGLSESALFGYFVDSDAIELTLQSTTPLNAVTLPAGTQISLSANFTATEPGYYQFAFTTANSDVTADSGLLLATGFVRILSVTQPTTVPTSNPTSSPTSTPQATSLASTSARIAVAPSPTPLIQSDGKQSLFHLSTPTCTDRKTIATMRLLLANTPQLGRSVTFTYAGESQTAVTDSAGEATVSFGYKEGSTDVTAMPADGYPTQTATIDDVPDCTPVPIENLMGGISSTSSGKVLGAYADTGLSPSDVQGFAIFGALSLMAVGLFLYGVSLVLSK